MKYEFVVDCFDKKGCARIQQIMTDEGFECEDLQGTLLGDHSGIKKFKTRKEADDQAQKLYRKHKKIINQITVR